MRTTLRPPILALLAGWSILILLFQTFKGANVGNPRLCATDPTCGEDGMIPVAVWLAGLFVFLVLGYFTRTRRS